MHYCLANGMRLATISSEQENDQVLNLIENTGKFDLRSLNET